MSNEHSRPPGDERPYPVTKDAIVKSDGRFPWMVTGKMSYQLDGTCNVLVIVPHGYPKDDNHTEKLGRDIVGELDAFAVINNQEYRRPKKDTRGKVVEERSLKIPNANFNCSYKRLGLPAFFSKMGGFRVFQTLYYIEGEK